MASLSWVVSITDLSSQNTQYAPNIMVSAGTPTTAEAITSMHDRHIIGRK